MQTTRYWGLFWVATGLAVHAFVVGMQLESSFFIILFFWGFVAISAVRGSLEIAQSMAVLMIILFSVIAAATLLGHAEKPSLAYTTFALYPALVSWVTVLLYIRYLRRRDEGELGRRPWPWRLRRQG